MAALLRAVQVCVVLAGLLMSGCDGCDLTDCGCTSGCFDDCAEGCDACSDCTGCDCACEGCTILPIPGGYPASERIPQATQVRLSPDGLEFIEDNLGDIAGPFLADFLGPGASLDNILAPVPGIQATVIEGPLATIITGAAGVCLQSSPFRSIGAAASAFAEGYAESAEFTVAEPTAAIVTSDAGFLSEAFARHVSIQVRDPASGNWVNACRQDSVIFIGVATVPTCGADLEPNRTYRITTGIGWSPLILPFPSIRADLFLADNNLCKVRASLQSLELSAVEDSPDRLRADVSVRVQTANAAGQPASLPVRGFGIVPDCSVSLNTELGPTADMRFRAEVAIVEEMAGSRAGFGKLEVVTARFLDPGLEREDMDIGCSGIVGLILALFEGPIYGTIEQTVEGLINERDLIAQVAAIPQAALPDPTNGNARTICPPGSVVDPGNVFGDGDGLCYLDENGNGVRDADPGSPGDYLENEPAPLMLGVEGRLDMGAVISAFSPGLRSAIDMLMAVDGEGDASGNGPALGYTVDLFGGFDTVEVAGCVPTLENPPTIPEVIQAAAFRGADDAHHISVGVSEEVINYGAYQLWQSGAMCLDVSSRLDQQLSTSGALGLLARTGFQLLSFPFSGAAIGIQVRPQHPPVITFGRGTPADDVAGIPADPFVSVSLPALQLHFYIWSSERFIRFMTLTGDLAVDILSLPMTDGVIQFTEDDLSISLANATVTNSELVSETPESLASAFQTAIGLATTMLGGVIPPIDVNAALNGGLLPVGARIEDDFLRLVESDGERFLGIYLDLARPTPAPLIESADTRLELVSLSIPEDTRAFEIASFGRGDMPSIEVALGAEGPSGVEYEFQHRLDRGTWSAWSRSPYAILSELSLTLEGHHTVEARARVVGSPASADMTPARIEFDIDLLAPRVRTVTTSEGTTLYADDIVSGPESLEYRHRELGETSWSAWQPVGTDELLVRDAEGAHEFEVRDAAGNVGRNTESLRGLPPPSDDEGCGDCAVQRGAARPPAWLLFTLLACLVASLRRQEKR